MTAEEIVSRAALLTASTWIVHAVVNANVSAYRQGIHATDIFSRGVLYSPPL